LQSLTQAKFNHSIFNTSIIQSFNLSRKHHSIFESLTPKNHHPHFEIQAIPTPQLIILQMNQASSKVVTFGFLGDCFQVLGAPKHGIWGFGLVCESLAKFPPIGNFSHFIKQAIPNLHGTFLGD
jgi:hypothetical protein